MVLSECELDSCIRQILPELTAFRRETHMHPELGMQEKATTARVKAILEKHGIAPSYIQGELGLHWLLEGGLPGDTLVLRGDMDALPVMEQPGLSFCSQTPGVMHACGHDLNTAYVLGAAIVLHQFRSCLRGKVKFIFQCAEETLNGARMAIANGVLDGLSPKYGFAFHAHPEHAVGHIGVRCGAAMSASDRIQIVVKGRGGHAAYPHLTVDPVVISAHVILALQTLAARYHHPADPLVITIGRISGGSVSNVTPDEVILQGTVRTFSPGLREELPGKMEQLCRLTAQAYGGDCELQYEKICPAIVVEETTYQAAFCALRAELGADHVDSIASPSMGSEDFSFFTERFPGMQIRVGTRYDAPRSALPLHNASILFSEESLFWGVKAGCALAFDLT